MSNPAAVKFWYLFLSLRFSIMVYVLIIVKDWASKGLGIFVGAPPCRDGLEKTLNSRFLYMFIHLFIQHTCNSLIVKVLEA